MTRLRRATTCSSVPASPMRCVYTHARGAGGRRWPTRGPRPNPGFVCRDAAAGRHWPARPTPRFVHPHRARGVFVVSRWQQGGRRPHVNRVRWDFFHFTRDRPLCPLPPLLVHAPPPRCVVQQAPKKPAPKPAEPPTPPMFSGQYTGLYKLNASGGWDTVASGVVGIVIVGARGMLSPCHFPPVCLCAGRFLRGCCCHSHLCMVCVCPRPRQGQRLQAGGVQRETGASVCDAHQ